MVLAAADLAGIELRLLSHYLARYDGGRYASILLDGDIHQVNADKVGVTRSQIKRITYAFLYSAGNQKLGLCFDEKLSPEMAKRKGQEIIRKMGGAFVFVVSFMPLFHFLEHRIHLK